MEPKGVSMDARERPRSKPSLNNGGREVDDIIKLFYFLLPPKWIELIIRHTDPLLDEHDASHVKLTEGELIRLFGYMLSLSIHTGIPLDKMWSKTLTGSKAAKAGWLPHFFRSPSQMSTLLFTLAWSI